MDRGGVPRNRNRFLRGRQRPGQDRAFHGTRPPVRRGPQPAHRDAQRLSGSSRREDARYATRDRSPAAFSGARSRPSGMRCRCRVLSSCHGPARKRPVVAQNSFASHLARRPDERSYDRRDCRRITMPDEPEPTIWPTLPRVSPSERSSVRFIDLPADGDVARELSEVRKRRTLRAAK